MEPVEDELRPLRCPAREASTRADLGRVLNRHRQGGIGDHPRSPDLLTADGEVRTHEPGSETSELFWTTAGTTDSTGGLPDVITTFEHVANVQKIKLDLSRRLGL
ncbi:hypothetical protein EIL87_17970 [Saccharopolyspora rhizosphaerae]|uniref:Uncharacterized protein n=1 Tax=Saccharopolyspora rhizosphaerae TaxID=2492662 RepID=A0A3R8QLL1_9PSEU|nr:hypothetical protein [Saccharopolyspora rhizosphaerae]RRO15149.1 hypothetical protein EIL87_17970 [Saccharopolyspora rhizosphaerae]